MKDIEENFSGDWRVYRIIFSTENPIETLYNLRYKYPLRVATEYIEYLEVRDAFKEIAEAEAKAEQKAEQDRKKATKR